MQSDKKITLVLDSSSAPLTAAISAGGRVYSGKKSGIKQEEYLFTMLKKLLAKAGCSLNDVNNFFFIKGPGRFTGIRISITLASMLAEITGTHIASASVFDILKYQAEKSAAYKKWKAANPGGVIAVITHAFRDEYFIAVYDGNQQPQWLASDALLARLNAYDKPLFIVGRDAEKILPAKFAVAPAALNKVQPRAMLAFAAAAPPPRADVLEPLYLKPARFELGNK